MNRLPVGREPRRGVEGCSCAAEILRLARATDLARNEDQRALGAVLDAVTREAALEDLRTREALVRLASFVERSPR